MNRFIITAFLFFIGSFIGWSIEVVFRRFFSAKKWINPGFLIGPYLPLYGLSLCILYYMTMLEQILPIQNNSVKKIVLFAIMALCITFVEYIAGVIFIKHMKIKLWDYSNERGNIDGIICPKFSFFWAVLSAIYYFGVHPHILDALKWLAENLAFSFCIGFFYGIFIIDLIYSTNLVSKIRKFSRDNDIVMKYEELKEHILNVKTQRKEKARFLLSMYSNIPITEHLKEYYEKHRDEYAAVKRKTKR